MAGVSSLVSTEQGKLADVQVAAATQYAQNQDALKQQYGKMAVQEEKQFDWDKIQPYVAAMKAASALKEAANKNIYGGIKGLTGAATMAATGGFNPIGTDDANPTIDQTISKYGDTQGGTSGMYTPPTINTQGAADEGQYIKGLYNNALANGDYQTVQSLKTNYPQYFQ
jgi:hypothetical protein